MRDLHGTPMYSRKPGNCVKLSGISNSLFFRNLGQLLKLSCEFRWKTENFKYTSGEFRGNRKIHGTPLNPYCSSTYPLDANNCLSLLYKRYTYIVYNFVGTKHIQIYGIWDGFRTEQEHFILLLVLLLVRYIIYLL